MVEKLKRTLSAAFDVKLFGALTILIGWKISRTPSRVKLNQAQYISRPLHKYGLAQVNPVSTLLPIHADVLPPAPYEPLLNKEDHAIYRTVVGGLLYLAVCTRPDISFSVCVLARQIHAPTARHLKLPKRILRYLISTIAYGLHFPVNTPFYLSAAVDTDWSGDQNTKRSTSVFLIAINGLPIFWRSKREAVLALSSAESEYVALTSCAKELSWMRKLHWEVCNQQPWDEQREIRSTIINIDSTPAMWLATNQQASARNKHKSLKIPHVRELLNKKIVELKYVQSTNNPADVLTKVMTIAMLQRMVTLLGLKSF